MPRAAFSAVVSVVLWAQMHSNIWHTVSGCVKDPHGSPTAGAVVRLKELEGSIDLTSTADAKGCYRLAEVPDGAYEVSAEQNGAAGGRKQIVLDARKRAAVVDLVYRKNEKPAPSTPAAPPMVNLKMLGRTSAFTAIPSAANSLVKSLTIAQPAILGGVATMARVSLVKPAPEGGVTIRILASNALVEVPPEIHISAGIVGEWFNVKTSRLRGPSDGHVRITATSGEEQASADLIVGSYTRLMVAVTGTGSGRVISAPGGIVCVRGKCSEPFRDGETVKLFAQPAAGSAFGAWSGDCNSDGIVVVSQPMMCTAEFAREQP